MTQSGANLESGDNELLSDIQTQTLAETLTIPVLEEQIQVHKEVRTTHVVRIHKSVRSENAPIQDDLAIETVDIERVPKDVFVDAAPSVRIEGEVTIIPVLEEVAVVTKRLRLVEEVRITKRRSHTSYVDTIPLRTETVAVERIAQTHTGSEA